MIYFFADNHFAMEPGKHLLGKFSPELRERIRFYQDDWTMLESGEWADSCELLILNMIAGTCNQPMPGPGAEKAVRRYCEKGGPILLLHGSSAAFWGWSWWRELPGLRWVRPNDPDQQIASTHPKAPCTIRVTKTRHPLAAKLRPFDLPEDEIYTALEETAPFMTLMDTVVNGETWPQCCETITPWHGRIVSFIPGHKPVCTENPDLVYNVETMVGYLLDGKAQS